MQAFSSQQVELFNSLFRGREDVFAVRWEKDGKSGYMPAYNLDWNEFSKHKANGGTLKDFKQKEYSPLTLQRIINHLSGKETLGIYPLLPDNTSWFIVVDFDENSSEEDEWVIESRRFISACTLNGIPAYLERSRSGNGGHVWIFFERNIPAIHCRKIVFHLLKKAGINLLLNKSSS